MEGLEAAIGDIDPTDLQTELELVVDRVRAIVGAMPGTRDVAKQAYVGGMAADHAYYDIFKHESAENPAVGRLLDSARDAHFKSADALYETDVVEKKFSAAFALLVGASTLIAEGTDAYARAAESAALAVASKAAALESTAVYTQGITG